MKAYLMVVVFATALVQSNGEDTSCWGQTNGLVLNNALVDANYYLCMNNVPIPMQCQSGYIFCQGGSACVTSCTVAPPPIPTVVPTPPITTVVPTVATPPTNVVIPTVPSPSSVACTGYPNGTMRTDPKNCRGYYMCVRGMAVPGTCANNYSFDGVRGTCVAAPCSSV